ncbi:MAG: hypothetical protein ACSLFM_00335 [Tepidiformaceae bacterium]
MFTIRRRLLAVTALALLAIAQVIPASANAISLTTSFCSTSSGYTVAPSYTESGTQSVAGAFCWRYLAMEYVDPISGSWIPIMYQLETYNVYESMGGQFTAKAYHSVFNNNQQGAGGWTYSWL